MKRNEKEVILTEDFAGKNAGESLVTTFGVASSLVSRGIAYYKGTEPTLKAEKEVKKVEAKPKKSHK